MKSAQLNSRYSENHHSGLSKGSLPQLSHDQHLWILSGPQQHEASEIFVTESGSFAFQALTNRGCYSSAQPQL